jgi:subtilisin-like proprotein convertase family protein
VFNHHSGLGMDKVIGQAMSFTSNTYFWEDLISTITGNWTLYVADDTSTVDLESWSLKFFYKNIIAKIIDLIYHFLFYIYLI